MIWFTVKDIWNMIYNFYIEINILNKTNGQM
jgi:hypothetical protein